MLIKPFINDNGIIELPGPFYEELNKLNINMNFTQNLITGVTNILPLLGFYELKTFRNEIRIKFKELPTGIKEAVDNSPDWKLDTKNLIVSFEMIEH